MERPPFELDIVVLRDQNTKVDIKDGELSGRQ